MCNPTRRWSALLLVLVAFEAFARDRDEASVRTLLLSDHPAQSAHRVFVIGQVTTVLRFEQPCDPARTKLLGWEGRFAPLLVGGGKVVLEPLRDLDPDERVPLLVTLTDGTEMTFLLAPPPDEEWAWTDQQVNVFKDRESYDAVLSSMYAALRSKRVLEEENERLRKEETSADHAFAALLVKGAAGQTSFQRKNTWSFKQADADVTITLFSGRGRAAVLFTIKNHDVARPWRLMEARLTSVSQGNARPAAVRVEHPSIPPGASGSIAIVADRSAFMDRGEPEKLALELIRHDGLRQALVVLDPRLVRE